MTPEEEHQRHALRAAEIYRSNMTPDSLRVDWEQAILQARKQVSDALRSSNYLRDVSGSLQASSAHMLTFRSLFAPPMSQDQFALLCNSYNKRLEKSGKPMSVDQATDVAGLFAHWRDRRLTNWLDRSENPKRVEVEHVLQSVGTVIALQVVATLRRNAMAGVQEQAVVQLLEQKGWTKKSTPIIKKLSDVPAKQFMHKAKFATNTRPQEVDIACGLGQTVVLAMECKVTNDETNSVKRVNDVLKKARAWQEHWGNFVKTAALLQGVVAFKDVRRLLEAGVIVFWSHELRAFETWLDSHVSNDHGT